MLGSAGDKIIIGYDLGDEFSQISYCYMSQDSEVETLSSVAGEECYNIPTVLCKRQGTGRWFFGKEALRFAQENPREAILVERLVELASAGEQVQIDGESYDPVALLTLFMKRSLGLLSMVSATERIVAMMITCRELDSRLIGVLNRTVTGLGLGYTRVYYQSYAESFYHYILYQPKDLWTYQTVLFDYREDGIHSMRMECNKRTTPIVAFVHQQDYPFSGESCLPEISGLETARLQQLDLEFLEVVRQECEERLVSSVYLIGESFAEGWMPRSLKYLCKGRRVFQGVNLYSKGAVYCLLEKHFGSETGRKYVFLGNDKLKYNIGMKVFRQGEESYYALLDAGVNWYEAGYSCEFYVQREASVALVITPLIAGSVARIPIDLKGLPLGQGSAAREGGYAFCELARIRMQLHLEGENRLCVELEDMGFGEIRPSAGLVWQREIVCGEDCPKESGDRARALVCVGDYAEEPYILPKLGIRVHCMEELCYCLKENAFLLNTGLMQDELLDFIREDCQLPGLAQILYPLVHQKGALSGFVSQILDYVGLYDRETLQQVEKTLRAGSGLSDYEKQKLQADHLTEQKRYEEALKAYDRLLAKIRENQEMEVPVLQELTAGILHNKGVIYARQMIYDQAAELLYQAWEASGGKEDYFADFLAAKRLQLPEQDYVALAAEYPDRYRISLELERILETAKQDFRETPEYKRLMQLRALRAGGEMNGYCEEIDKILGILKDDCRKQLM